MNQQSDREEENKESDSSGSSDNYFDLFGEVESSGDEGFMTAEEEDFLVLEHALEAIENQPEND